ncbi:MAG: hypothetical protein CMJ85_13150 [Planctomycetes bacterium]|jgi:Zn-dependent protease|nr:hypothetical protein [Planctomycetota bacterium]
MDFDFAAFLTWYIALVVTMVFHEAAHAWVALLGGDRTAYEAGQVTLNPVPHVQREPFGMIVLPIISFSFWGFPLGFAHAPYNPYWADAHPKRAAVMSAAGPGANLLIAAILLVVMKVGIDMEWFEIPDRSGFGQIVVGLGGGVEGASGAISRIISVLFFLNLLLGLFNLIPIPPLDGAGIVEGLFSGPVSGFYRVLRSNPMFSIMGIMVAWYVAGDLILPVFTWALRFIYA